VIKQDNLRAFQAAHNLWLKRNFPNQQPADGLLGVIEEVGELAHAHLKASQGIRGDASLHRAEAADAIGDIMIYLASYCNTNGYDMAGCLEDAWEEVSRRDWQASPETGVATQQPETEENPG
jgi:NTP pyrophosphatase (non-canonical NTP hydrolase)